MMKNILFGSLFLLIGSQSHALVDYSDSSSDSNKSSNRSEMKMPAASNRESSSSLIWKSDLSFETNYEILKVDNQSYGLVNLNTHLQTPFNIYLDLNYWSASGAGRTSSGNPKMILGFNWFKIGNPTDQASINLYGGMKLKSNSDLGSSRTDKVFGIETTKKFSMFGLGLGYDATIAGTPASSSEMAVGTIHRIEVSGGWVVSNDIQFEVSVENFKVSKGTETSHALNLLEDVSFSTISPKMNLQIFRSVNFELGARYPMNKAKSKQDLKAAKLTDLHGVYGSSVFTGLNISI
jgi:hypothetical protein